MADFTLTGNVIRAQSGENWHELGKFVSSGNLPREVVLSGTAPSGEPFEAVLHIRRDDTGTPFDPLANIALNQQITLDVTIS